MTPSPSNQSAEKVSGAVQQNQGLRIWRILWAFMSGLCVWFLFAVILGRVVVAVFPVDPAAAPIRMPLGWLGSTTFGLGLTFRTSSGLVPVGITLHWWNIPGTIVGAVLGVLRVRSVLRCSREV